MHEDPYGFQKAWADQPHSLPEGKRLLVGICGIPGSGKSSLARRVADRLNHATAEPVAIVIGMDGWHYTRQQLSLSDDPKHAFDRRGAEFTFDSSRFADFVVQLGSIKDHTVKAPSFDHAKKDPLEDDIQVLPQHRVALIEGLYCNCNVEHWKRAAEVLHHRWVCLISRDEAKRRLVARHVATGVAKDEAEAIWRGECKTKSSLVHTN